MRLNQLARLGLSPNRAERALHLDLVAGRGRACRLQALAWLAKFYRANAKAAVYDKRLLALELRRWLGICARDRVQGFVRFLERRSTFLRTQA